MAETLFLRKTALNKLEPDNRRSEEIMASLSRSVTFKATLTQPRNIKFHRKFFALLDIIYDNQEHYKSVDELLYAIKFKLGYVVPIRMRGSIGHMPKSISFAKMDQRKFDEFYARVLDFIQAEVIPGIDRADLVAELEAF